MLGDEAFRPKMVLRFRAAQMTMFYCPGRHVYGPLDLLGSAPKLIVSMPGNGCAEPDFGPAFFPGRFWGSFPHLFFVFKEGRR